MYRICDKTFPPGNFGDGRNKREAWEKIINHAFGQWELATAGLVRVVEDSDDCTNYTSFIEDIMDQYVNDVGDLRYHVESFLQQYEERLRGLHDQDNRHNEVLMFDDIEGTTRLFVDVGVFPALANDLGYSWGWKNEYLGKTRDGTRSYVYKVVGEDKYDMFMRRGAFEEVLPKSGSSDPEYPEDSLKLPGDGDEDIERDDRRFNSCHELVRDDRREQDIHFTAYGTLLHEAGHALGVRAKPHPAMPSSVMNALSEPDCWPHPLDIMAIYALYQTRVTP